MKLKVFLSMCLLCSSILIWGQIYTTAPSRLQQHTQTGMGYYAGNGMNAASSSDYQGVQNPYLDSKPFSSTAVMTSTYTVAVSAQDIANVGLAQEPSYISPIFRAPDLPILPGEKEDDMSFSYPIGDGTWVLLSCACLFLLFRIVSARKHADKDVKE